VEAESDDLAARHADAIAQVVGTALGRS
jgi:hypothetical protein